MKRILFFAVLLLLNLPVANATNYPSERIKRFATHTPREVENNIHVLTRHLIKPLDDDYDKAKMIAFWIASHINYDEYLYNDGQTSKLIKRYDGQDPNQLLSSRVGICGDFAKLFTAMCKQAGIFSGVVHGYAYPTDMRMNNSLKNNNYGHAWNYFLYRGKKIYVDTTFMADGRTGTAGGVRNLAHKRTLRKIKNENQFSSKVNNFDDYYFDFNYKKEKRDRGYLHEER